MLTDRHEAGHAGKGDAVKRVCVAVLTSLLIAMVAQPASAGPPVQPRIIRPGALCKVLFAPERCEEIRHELRHAVANPDQAKLRALAKRVVDGALSAAPSNTRQIPCELIFSDQVCDALGQTWQTLEDIANNPGGTVDNLRRLIVAILDQVVDEIQCVLNPNTCGTRSANGGDGADDEPGCRDVFSENVCDRVENPGAWVAEIVGNVWAFVRCYIDPDCALDVVAVAHRYPLP